MNHVSEHVPRKCSILPFTKTPRKRSQCRGLFKSSCREIPRIWTKPRLGSPSLTRSNLFSGSCTPRRRRPWSPCPGCAARTPWSTPAARPRWLSRIRCGSWWRNTCPVCPKRRCPHSCTLCRPCWRRRRICSWRQQRHAREKNSKKRAVVTVLYAGTGVKSAWKYVHPYLQRVRVFSEERAYCTRIPLSRRTSRASVYRKIEGGRGPKHRNLRHRFFFFFFSIGLNMRWCKFSNGRFEFVGYAQTAQRPAQTCTAGIAK